MTQPHDGPDAGQPAGYAYPVFPAESHVPQPEPAGYGHSVMPAPMMYVPPRRPGVVTAAAVLAYVQAGITGVIALILFVGLFARAPSTGALLVDVLVVLATATGAALLIAGGVRLTGGRGRVPLVVACVLEFAICVYYIVVFATLSASEIDPTNELDEVPGGLGVARGTMVFIAIFFAIMPTISLALACGRSATAFLRSRHP